jgi:Fe-S oxidoreductase
MGKYSRMFPLRDWIQLHFHEKLKRVNAGSQIGRLNSPSGILSQGLITLLTLLGIFPLIVRHNLGPIRKRYHRSTGKDTPAAKIPSDSKLAALQCNIVEHCCDCRACIKSCAFLTQYGTPKSIVTDFDFSSSEGQSLAYKCSLCGLCTAVCPEKLDPAGLFLEVRRRCVADGNFNESVYRTILGYEKRGASPLFSWYGLPKGCNTIFFPGCTLPGTRPTVTTELYRQIQEIIPTVGLVLDCCAKPSHDLGRTAGFRDIFDKMHNYLTSQGIRTVLTACPNCTKMFRQYGHGMTVRTVYEILPVRKKDNSALEPGIENAITVHDPCPLRDDLPTQQAVRKMLDDMGHTLVEMKHHGKRTLCCGEGGTVAAVNPSLAKAWTTMRSKEAGGLKIVTYCAGCTGYLNRVVPTIHIVDLLYRPEVASNGNLKIARAPFTYWHRLRLKQRMKKELRT